jgi:hypothetical protein
MADRHDWDIQCHTHNITVWRAILLETQRTFSKDDKGVYLIWLTDSYFFLKISVGSKNINCSLPISSKLDKMFPWVMTGGRSIPEDCRARHHVAMWCYVYDTECLSHADQPLLHFITKNKIAVLYIHCRWSSNYQESMFEIPLASLTSPQFCACPKRLLSGWYPQELLANRLVHQ